MVAWLCSIEPCLPRLFFGASIATVNGCTEGASTLQVLLDEARTEVNVDLYQRRVTKRLETMDLARLNDKDISRAALEGFAVDRPHSPAFTNKLNLVIGVPVRARPRTRPSMKQEHRNARVSLLSSNKLMRATNKRQILLAHVMHLCHLLWDWMSVATIPFRGERRSLRGRYPTHLRLLAPLEEELAPSSGNKGS